MTMFSTLNTEGLIEQDNHLVKSNRLTSDPQLTPSIPKQPYVPPSMKLMSISSSTLNNAVGGGDGDSALANS